jgi:hypothetical protein
VVLRNWSAPIIELNSHFIHRHDYASKSRFSARFYLRANVDHSMRRSELALNCAFVIAESRSEKYGPPLASTWVFAFLS